jgi:hypothetical protein
LPLNFTGLMWKSMGRDGKKKEDPFEPFGKHNA